jgi:hypothetical protein
VLDYPGLQLRHPIPSSLHAHHRGQVHPRVGRQLDGRGAALALAPRSTAPPPQQADDVLGVPAAQVDEVQRARPAEARVR